MYRHLVSRERAALRAIRRLGGYGDLERSRWLPYRCVVGGMRCTYNPAITDADLSILSNFSHLSFVSVRGSSVTGAFLQNLPRPRALEVLDLGMTKFDPALAKMLSRFPHLVVLFLDECRISDEVVEHLVRMRWLTHLFVGPEDLTLHHIQQLTRLPSITSLHISGNCMTSAEVTSILKDARPGVSISLHPVEGQVEKLQAAPES